MIEFGQLDQFLLIKFLNSIATWHTDFDKGNNPYNELILINSDNPQIALNRIINCNKDVYKFFSNLSTVQKSALVPKIELFCRRDNQWKLIHFRNFPNFGEFSNFATDITTQFGFKENEHEKEDGVGIKRITIADRNQNPGSVNLECTLELFFDSILALTNSSILKLIQTADNRGAASEREFRLKLVAGWSTPTDYKQEIFSPEQLTLIEKSNSVYLLSLVKHDLTFNQNGSINLSITYQGAIEKYLASSSEMDIFGNTSPAQLIKFLTHVAKDESGHLTTYIVESTNKFYYEALIDQLSKSKLTPSQQESNVAILETIEESKKKDSKGEKEIDEKIEKAQEKLDESLKKLSQIEMFVVKHKYKKFLIALQNQNRLFYLRLDALKYLELNKSFQVNNKEFWDKKLAEIENGAVLANFNKQIATGDNLAAMALSLQKQRIEDLLEEFRGDQYFAGAYGAADEETREKIRQEARKKAESAVDLAEISAAPFEYQDFVPKQGVSKVRSPVKITRDDLGLTSVETTGVDPNSDKDKYITYTTLGDIINVARGFIEIPPDENVEILIGPCNVGSLSINIAQFPIAISTFHIWFTNTVIRKSVRKYQFWEFIYDIINSLITPFLRMDGLISKETVNINLAKSIVISDQKLDKGKSYLDTELYNYLSRNIFDTNNVYSYLALYIYDYELDRRDGIEAEDIEDGIYHYSLARDRGIVKNIEFSKIDFPRMRDMRLTSEGFNNVGDILRENYNMTLKTIGSPLFVVGSQVYFDGAYLGESGRNITELLGLGGYYLVTKIDTNLAKDLYETNVECTWTAMRKTSAAAYKMIDPSGKIKK